MIAGEVTFGRLDGLPLFIFDTKSFVTVVVLRKKKRALCLQRRVTLPLSSRTSKMQRNKIYPTKKKKTGIEGKSKQKSYFSTVKGKNNSCQPSLLKISSI